MGEGAPPSRSSSPLMGEDRGGGDAANLKRLADGHITLPLLPSHQGRGSLLALRRGIKVYQARESSSTVLNWMMGSMSVKLGISP